MKGRIFSFTKEEFIFDVLSGITLKLNINDDIINRSFIIENKDGLLGYYFVDTKSCIIYKKHRIFNNKSLQMFWPDKQNDSVDFIKFIDDVKIALRNIFLFEVRIKLIELVEAIYINPYSGAYE